MVRRGDQDCRSVDASMTTFQPKPPSIGKPNVLPLKPNPPLPAGMKGRATRVVSKNQFAVPLMLAAT